MNVQISECEIEKKNKTITLANMKWEILTINYKYMDILFLFTVMPGTERSLDLDFDSQLKIKCFYLN